MINISVWFIRNVGRTSEDNLDSEFIYKTLVPVIRAAKERMQVIVVTQNANIAVLGDAELIAALKATK